MRLQNKVAIITGAGKGIGKGIAKVFSQEGARVVIAELDSQAGTAAAEELRQKGGEVFFIRTDVSNENHVKEMVQATLDRYGAIHILVNNAGIGVYKSVLETSTEEWDHCLKVNLKGPFLCSKYVIPHMKAAGGGSIIHIASVHAFATTAATAPYAASKGGLVALTRNMAIDYAKDNIRVNAICPGWILTPLVEGIFASASDPQGMKRRITERQLLGRLGTPEDIGRAALFLASDDSSFITGTMLVVDGGLTAQLETWE